MRRISSATASAPRSMPRRSCMALAPATTALMPSLTMACASTVAVVVPSPATSLVCVAACLSSCTPRFSTGSGSSISLATVTPSCVTVGAPYFLPSATLRPLGPSVTATADESVSMPWRRVARASSSYTIILGIRHTSSSDWGSLPDHREHVRLAQEQIFLVVDLELGPGVLGEQDALALVHVERLQLA